MQYLVIRTLENEHATCVKDAFHHPGAILDAAQLRETSIPILIEAGVIAPTPAPATPTPPPEE